MDVGMPSNLERIRWLYGGDDDALRRDVVGVAVDDEQTLACMADVYRRTGYVLDPHSAVAYHASQERSATREEPVVVLSTAHPGKFPEIVQRALGRKPPIPAGLARARTGTEHVRAADPTLASLTKLLEDIDR
jgi:threonine synthase